MLKPILSSLSLSSLIACAAGTTGTAARPLEPVRTASCAVKADPAGPAFPAAIDPKLPSVDRIARLVEAELGARAAAEVDLCVSRDGRVVAVSLVHATRSPAFDLAVVHDVAEWQFAAPAAPADRTCKRATISYVGATRMAAR
jgi:outer membrane biosynthesis protein TonB